jgi:RNA polymerase sigma-70 factor, ECF subfamily
MFATVVQRWQGGLQRVAQAITGNVSTAEEVVQETWVSVLRSLATFEGRSSLRTWVHRVCAHVALARTRRDEREPVPGEPVVEPGCFDEHGHWREPPARWAEETPEALAARREVMDCIERTVAMLPVRQRAVITLRDGQGFTAEDACEILGGSAVHQRVLLHRARSRVRAECARFYREVA